MYETFEHTADLGLRIRAADLDALFAEAGLALTSAIVERVEAIEPRQRIDLEIEAGDLEYLLFDWLNELLFQCDSQGLVFGKFEVRVAGELESPRLTATVWGEPLTPERHGLGHEVKAITYHGLKVKQSAGGWLAEVIVDI